VERIVEWVADTTTSFITTAARSGPDDNYSGGIQGGISNGEEIYFNVLQAVATIMQDQQSVDKEGRK